ncbi:MAG: hypothetical protein ABIN94_18375 [Ferruginibacter sp.]
MNSKLLLIVICVAAFSSCTTLYKSGQTPDDVYYSPARPAGDGGHDEQRRDDVRDQARNNNVIYDNYGGNTYEDRSIRLGINDRRWRYFDNDYAYNPYNYGFNYGYYYNPYFYPYPVYSPVFFTPVNPKNTTPRMINLGGYNATGYSNVNIQQPGISKMGVVRPSSRSYNNNNNRSAVGNVIRQIFTPPANTNYNNNNSNNNNYNNSTNNNTRTYTPSTPSSNTSSSSGSSSSGSGSVSRPARSGGN